MLPEKGALSRRRTLPRHNAIRVVVRHRINSCTDRKASHLRGIERRQNLRKLLHIFEAGIEPKIVGVSSEDYRHSIMYVRQ